jgi:hypothetical protein
MSKVFPAVVLGMVRLKELGTVTVVVKAVRFTMEII